jgi:hypothetical protein
MVYGLSTILILLINLHHLINNKIGLYFLFSNLYYFIYVVVPFLLQYGYISKPESGGAIQIISKYNNHKHLIEYANILVLIGLIAILVFSFYKPSKKTNIGISSQDIYRAGVLCVVVGTVAYGAIVYLAGGVLNLLAMANELRAGEKTLPGGFLIHFSKFVWAGSIIIFGSLLEGHKSKGNYLLMIFSLIISLMVLLSMAGRALFIIYFASFPFTFYIKNQKIYYRYTLILMIITILLILYGDYLFRSFSDQGALEARTEIIIQGGFFWIIQNILREFIFPYTNVLLSIEEIKNITDLYFLELPRGIINTLPGGAVGISYLDTLSDVNTLRYNTTGEIPVDIISFGYHTLGVIGVMVSISFYTLIFSNIDQVFFKKSSATFISFHSLLACKLCFVAMYADLHQVISGNFYIISLVFLIFMFKEIRVNVGRLKESIQ